MPSVTKSVTIKPTKVVTSAIPPTRNVAFFSAILNINGPNITVDNVKIATATTNDIPSTENPLNNADAASSPIAFATSEIAKFAKKRTIFNSPIML